uniref:Uncharacterized protein n=1 Tax=Panagrolaimus sp. ES5 TaxID=591445 RepID=A0AC34FER7_9BILA
MKEKWDQRTVDNVCVLTISLFLGGIATAVSLLFNLPVTAECQKLLLSDAHFALLKSNYFDFLESKIIVFNENVKAMFENYHDQKKYREICFNPFSGGDIPFLIQRYQKEKAEQKVRVLNREIQSKKNIFEYNKEKECQNVLLSDKDWAELESNYTRLSSSYTADYDESERSIFDNYRDQKKYREICSNLFPVYSVPFLLQQYQKQKAEREVASLQFEIATLKDRLKKEKAEEKQKLQNLLAAFAEASEKIENGLIRFLWIPIDPFKQCLENYNKLVENVAKIFHFDVVQ